MMSKNISWKPLNCIFKCGGQVSLPATEHSGRQLCADAGKQSSHQFLGCWFLLSNLFTSPIHNIFTGYFFKKCIGRVLKTTRGLLIMDNAPRCSVRCLPNSWQQCLSIIGLSFFSFFSLNTEREIMLRVKVEERLDGSLEVTDVQLHPSQFVLGILNKQVKNGILSSGDKNLSPYLYSCKNMQLYCIFLQERSW